MKQVQENGRNGIRWKINNKLDDLDFADDFALVSSSFQQTDDKRKLATYASRTGLKINANKTKLMRINTEERRPIYVNGIHMEDVEEFTYLGATVSTKAGGTEDMSSRLNKGRQTFRRLNKTWNSSVYSKRSKDQNKAVQRTGPASGTVRLMPEVENDGDGRRQQENRRVPIQVHP